MKNNKNKSIDEMFDEEFPGTKNFELDMVVVDSQTLEQGTYRERIKNFIHTIIDKEKKELVEGILNFDELPTFEQIKTLKNAEEYKIYCLGAVDMSKKYTEKLESIIQKKI